MEIESQQKKVGLFILLVLVLLAYATIKISKTSIFPGGSYTIFLYLQSANGLSSKTPVQISGIEVGSVTAIDLVENNRARLELSIDSDVQLSKRVQARVRSLGFLGDSYVELVQPAQLGDVMRAGDTIQNQNEVSFGSVNDQISDITTDVKAITHTMRELMAGQDSSFARSLKNIEKITDTLANVSVKNEDNLNVIIENLRALSENLNAVVARNTQNVDTTLGNLAAVSQKVKNGEGTIGRLLNDETTVDKLNESIDNLNELLGGANKMQVELGYHAEYLGTTEKFKNYVALNLKPRPDKAFMFELVSDPLPSASRETKETDITSGGVTTTVVERTRTTSPDKYLFSAQIAKTIYGLTVRGGLIESRGGAGIDYAFGPAKIQFSAFDFQTDEGRRPHLKTMGTLNVTRSFYLLAGLDDFISQEQDPDWFMGAGFQFTDDDIKSLFGLLSAKPK